MQTSISVIDTSDFSPQKSVPKTIESSRDRAVSRFRRWKILFAPISLKSIVSLAPANISFFLEFASEAFAKIFRFLSIALALSVINRFKSSSSVTQKKSVTSLPIPISRRFLSSDKSEKNSSKPSSTAASYSSLVLATTMTESVENLRFLTSSLADGE